MTRCARRAVRLVEQGARAVLIKGGHGEGAESVDVLQAPGSFTRLATERIATKTPTAPAARSPRRSWPGLPRALDLVAAVREAKAYVSAAIAAAGPAHDRLRARASAPFPCVVGNSEILKTPPDRRRRRSSGSVRNEACLR